MTTAHKTPTGPGWHPHFATADTATLDMTPARQIALRVRLRNHYWLKECEPFTVAIVTQTRKKMVMIDKRDKLTEAEVDEVMTAEYGFIETPEGWTIPELLTARGVAIGAAQRRSEAARKGGIAKAGQRSIQGAGDAQKTLGDDAADF